MKRITITTVALLMFACAALAQEAKKEADFNTVRDFRSRVFTVQNRDARTVYQSLALLGSGFKGAGMSINEELRTITVRDFPENLATIEDALKRLDQPATQSPDLEMRISVLIGSKTPLNDASVPEELAPVIKQLQATLRYAHYGLMTTTVQRTKIGNGIEGSGVAEPTLLGMTADQKRPIFYSYRLRTITSRNSKEQPAIDIESFQFQMKVPLDIGGGSIQYQAVGFETPVSIRQREKVVIGTTSMNDKALIVVVSANVSQ